MKVPRNLVISFAVILLAVFVYLIITMKRTFVRYNGRLPYVWNYDLNQTLSKYLQTYPTRGVLLLTGPYQCGKSRAMNIAADFMIKNKQFVINVDATTARTPYDVVELFKSAIYNGLTSAYSFVSYSRIRSASELFPPNSQLEIEALDPALSTIYAALAKDLDNSLINPYSIVSFFDTLELLYGKLNAVIFIHGLETLKSIAPILYQTALSRIGRRLLYNDNVPIVCEVRDSSFRLTQPTLPSYVILYEMRELRDPTHDWIVSTRAFSSIEMRKVLERFGGHGGTIERVFEDLKVGIGIDESVEAQQSAVKTHLRKMLTGDVPSVLAKLCYMNGTMRVQEKGDLMPIVNLLKSGHLYLSDNGTLKVAHKGVREALCGKRV
ncbi:hypothetical protein GPJ56_002664 [Histomonas meleagridis]|uniref:uncharacterized protein n=1 Tax=Histomonas meleagridis TaxID=135588 RepID=UPI00355A180E|nr:hypothetical protein GPJ56_002664 [Histomonas meleagridis]KAH0797869.1 hypothetical protein GO595_009498 [Histomonas meleagridis]